MVFENLNHHISKISVFDLLKSSLVRSHCCFCSLEGRLLDLVATSATRTGSSIRVLTFVVILIGASIILVSSCTIVWLRLLLLSWFVVVSIQIIIIDWFSVRCSWCSLCWRLNWSLDWSC